MKRGEYRHLLRNIHAIVADYMQEGQTTHQGVASKSVLKLGEAALRTGAYPAVACVVCLAVLLSNCLTNKKERQMRKTVDENVSSNVCHMPFCICSEEYVASLVPHHVSLGHMEGQRGVR